MSSSSFSLLPFPLSSRFESLLSYFLSHLPYRAFDLDAGHLLLISLSLPLFLEREEERERETILHQETGSSATSPPPPLPTALPFMWSGSESKENSQLNEKKFKAIISGTYISTSVSIALPHRLLLKLLYCIHLFCQFKFRVRQRGRLFSRHTLRVQKSSSGDSVIYNLASQASLCKLITFINPSHLFYSDLLCCHFLY